MSRNSFFKISAWIFIAAGFAVCLYDPLLIIMSPGTFLDNLTAFSHVWLVPGSWLIFTGIWRLKKGCAFCGILGRGIRIAAAVLFSAGILVFSVSLYFILTPDVAPLSTECDYVIVLGGGIDRNGKLPETVRRRVEKAAEYLELHPGAVAVVTGGTLKFLPYPEGPAIKRLLVEYGIAGERILLEDKALDTIQNFRNSCGVLSEHEGISRQQVLDSRIAVVTSRFHLARAERLAARMGFSDVSGLASSIPAVYVPHLYLREVCAYLKLNLRILLTGEPSPLS